ncbi:hypothetical protein Goshw_025535 [Gossypium schwendimanii]|uniref:Prolamin-like domain-containing protein n=1 Tax=Gossypium schwendimanii TaxID=34291 RepID=A0A7J9KUN7_GOSSC|nr:hypothetical protein [Gossypium schwendimanii]
MAKLNHNLSMVIALLSSILIAASTVTSEEEFMITIPPEPEPGFYKTIEECIEKMSRECGENIVKAVLEDEEISEQCCVELVHGMGKICHDDLLQFYVSLPQLGFNVTHLNIRGQQVWNICILKAPSKM